MQTPTEAPHPPRHIVLLTEGRSDARPLALARVAGISVVERLIVDSAGARFDDITVAVPRDADEIRRHVLEVSRRRGIAVSIACDEGFATRVGDPPVVFLVADRVVSPSLLGFLRAQRLRPGEVVLSSGGNVYVTSSDDGVRRSQATDAAEHWSLPVRDGRERRIATRRLVQMSAKPYDGTLALRINRPFSDAITFATVSLFPAMTSVQVTLVAFAVACAGASVLALGIPVLAAVLIQLATILDRVDGHVARVTKRPSAFGCYLDPVLDRVSDGLVMIGAGIYLAAVAVPSPVAIGVSGAALLSHVLVSYTSSKATIELGHCYQGALLGIGRGRDRRMLIVSGGALLAFVEPMAVLVSLLPVTVLSTWIVVTRLVWSWWLSGRGSAVGGVQAVVLDFDGTIADSMGHLTGVAADLLVESGGLTRPYATARYLATAGADFRSQLTEIIPGHAATTSIARRFEAAKQTWMPQCEAFPDVLPALKRFSSAGVPVFVCSSTSLPLVREFCRRTGLLPHLTSVEGWCPGYDKSEQLAHALTLSGCSRDQVVFVGDARRDAHVAHVNRIRFIGLVRERSPDLFQGTGEHVVASLGDLARDVGRALRSPIATPLLPTFEGTYERAASSGSTTPCGGGCAGDA